MTQELIFQTNHCHERFFHLFVLLVLLALIYFIGHWLISICPCLLLIARHVLRAKVVKPLYGNNNNNNNRALFETSNQELSLIYDRFLTKIISLNLEKTKYMLFHKLTDQENIPLKLPSLRLNGHYWKRIFFKVSWCYSWWTLKVGLSLSKKTFSLFALMITLKKWWKMLFISS